jgi:hypothetical protein
MLYRSYGKLIHCGRRDPGAHIQCDRDLRRRIRKVPGVPLMYVVKHKYSIERLPEYVPVTDHRMKLTSSGGAAF